MWFCLRQLTAAALLAAVSGAAFAADEWQAQVGEALGKTGTPTPSGIYRVGLPRTDLKVTLDGVELKAGFALGSLSPPGSCRSAEVWTLRSRRPA